MTESLLHAASDEEEDESYRHGHYRGEQPHGVPSAAAPAAAGPNRHTAIIPYPGEFNLQAFLNSIFAWWQRVFGNLLAYAAALLPPLAGGLRRQDSEPAMAMSLLQLERLQQLRERVAEKFDITSNSHQDALRRLWSLAFPGMPCTALKTPQWKEMGWQGEDPATDFRGAGFYGLENLMYLGQRHPEVFRRLKDKQDGVRAEWEYPFAVAGLNITWMLSELLELHTPLGAPRDAPPKSAPGRAFVALLGREGDGGSGGSDSGSTAFEELYCATYLLLDATWLEMRASYMEFNAVMKRVKEEVTAALAARPDSMAALRTRLVGPAAAATLE